MTGKYRQHVMPVVAAVLLSACGGGSSGPAPIQEPPAPIFTYTGNRQPILVTQSNAAQLASRAFSLRHITQSLESLWVDAPFGQNDSERTTAGRYSGSVNLRIQTDSSGRGYGEAIFRDFSDNAGSLINGRYLQRFRPEPRQSGTIDFSVAGPGSLEFDNLTLSADQDSLNLLGIITITGYDSDIFFVNLLATDTQSGETLYYENCRLSFSEANVGRTVRPALDLSCTIYEQDEGSIEFRSLGPIPDLGFSESAGYFVGGAGGGIELVSSGPLTHIRPISFAFASIIMDMDDDGTPETAKRYSWPEISGETVVESSVMPGPIANAGSGRTPKPGSPVKMHGLFSHDDDGDWLTFDWQLITKPVQSAVSVQNTSARPFFEFTPDVPGDYLFSLRVSDETSASKTSVVIRHTPAAVGDSDDEPIGGLEVGQPIAVAMPVIIDGRSAMNWPYNQSKPFWSRAGFGRPAFGETGDLASTYFTVENEVVNRIGFRQNVHIVGVLSLDVGLSLAIGPTIFETAIELAGNAKAVDVHELDYDGDGDQDLALRVGLAGDERILILLSSPDGLTPGPEVSAGSSEIATGDVNGDGLADILSASDAGLLLFRQNPDHSLSAPTLIEYTSPTCEATTVPTDIALDEVDGDGRIDIVAAGVCSGAITTWLQRSDGTFGPPAFTTFQNGQILSAAFGDVNNDGKTDFVASLAGASIAFPAGVSILLSQPDGTMVEGIFVANTEFSRQGVTVGDIDNDGRNDVVVVSNREIFLLRQQADSSLSSSVVYAGPELRFSPAVSLVDADGDGKKDIFFCATGPTMRLLVQQQDGTFNVVIGSQCPSSNKSLRQAEVAVSFDLNNDGIVELVTLSEDDRALLKVFFQNVHGYSVPDLQGRFP